MGLSGWCWPLTGCGLLAAALASPAPGGPSPGTAELPAQLRRAARYVAGYEKACGLLVAEEDYFQRLLGIGGKTRSLRSDVLFVRLPVQIGWFGFRDVFEVDGRAVRDRDGRLARLFLKPAPDSLAQARRILAEASRHNLGRTRRNFNVPTLPLLVLEADRQSRFRFRIQGAGTVSGHDCVRLSYAETARPTLIQDLSAGDLPMRGALLLDRETAAVLQAELRLTTVSGRGDVSLDVRFGWHPGLDLWLPDRMRERYHSSSDPNLPPEAHARGETIQVEARYSNWRRFEVDVHELIGPPVRP